jgi:dihydrofolate reductase
MEHFKKQTMGSTVIMGRKTWESIPEKYRPLEGRVNIVISRQKDYKGNCIVVDSLSKALKKSANDKNTFIIGGGEIYKESLKFVDTIYLTRVHTTIEGDTTFPTLNEEWVLENETKVTKDTRNELDMTFKIYKRR